MNRSRIELVLALFGFAAIWGCSQHPSPAGAVKTSRLQEEVRTLTAAVERLRLDLKATQSERDRLTADSERMQAEIAQLKQLAQERDQFQKELATRTAERDHYVSQIDHVRRNLQSILSSLDGTKEAAEAATIGAAVGLTPTGLR